MTTPVSPKLIKAGLVLIDPETAAIRRVIALQYNPDTLSRSMEIKAMGEEGGRSQPLRLTGPAVETFNIEAEIDATDQLADPSEAPAVVEAGLFPALSALESLVNPTSAALAEADALLAAGTLEIAPMETPLALFVWSRSRIVPVRITSLSITEEAFDERLNPIRAKATLALRALTVEDLGYAHYGSAVFMAYLKSKERLAKRAPRGALERLGIEGLP